MINNNQNYIEIENLKIGYKANKRTIALAHSINLKAKKGEFIALVGSNGSGKSTFLRTLCQLQSKLKGTILFTGIEARQITKNKIARLVSLVSTEMHRTSKLKVFDLVALGRFPYSSLFVSNRANDAKVVITALNQVGMLNFKDRFITELSDGEYQRVMIARALAQDTPIVVLDEPTAFLDLPNKYSIVQLLWKLCRDNGKTIIYSTHDINIALQFADLFWVLNNEVIIDGAPEDLLLNETIEQLFNDKNLEFDLQTFQFTCKKEPFYNIHLIGEGKELLITKMALIRLGISTDCNKLPKLIVTITKNVNGIVWSINKENKKLVFYSIYELQLALKELVSN